MNKVLWIVGAQVKTRDLAPWENLTNDIWVLNEAMSKGWAKRASAVFQLHSPAVYRNPYNVNDMGHWAWLQREHEFPIYMQEADPDVPAAVRFPIEDVRAVLDNVELQAPDGKLNYFTSTFPYLLGLAIIKGYEEVHICGVEMAAATEYNYQLNGYLFWLGVLAGKGAKLVLHSGHWIFDKLMYGYDGDAVTLPLSYFEERGEKHAAVLANHQKRGANLARAMRRAMQDGDDKEVAKLVTEREMLAVEWGKADGARASAEMMAALQKKAIDEGSPAPLVDRQSCEQEAARAMAGDPDKRALAQRMYANGDKEKAARIAEVATGAEELRERMWKQSGMTEYVWNVWSQTKSEQAAEQFTRLHDEHLSLAFMMGQRLGTHQEFSHYTQELDRKIEAAGGSATVDSMVEAQKAR